MKSAPDIDLADLSDVSDSALQAAASIERDLADWQASHAADANAGDAALSQPAEPPRVVWVDSDGQPIRLVQRDTDGRSSSDNPPPDSISDAASKLESDSESGPEPNSPGGTPGAGIPGAGIPGAGSPGVGVGDRINALMVELARELNYQAADGAHPMRELALIAAMTLVRPERQINPDAFPDLTAREREILTILQQFFIELGQSFTTTADVDEAMATAVSSLRSKLQELHLQLSDLRLCTRVSGFSDYQEFTRKPDEPYRFLAHSRQQAIIYVAVDDFSSNTNEAGEFVTELSQQLVIYSDRDGIPVWTEPWQLAVDRTRNRRQDFFLVQRITLPESLSVGRYQLKVRLRDEQTGAEAEKALTFEMVADARLAGK